MPEPQIWPGGADIFRASRLYKKLLDKVPMIDQMLQENGAVIAGGSVLSAIAQLDVGVPSGDLDIYVHCKNYKNFRNAMMPTRINKPKAIAYKEYDWHRSQENGRGGYKASDYCKSFLRKNGIRTVHNFYISNNEQFGSRDSVDIMAVRHRRKILDLVQNFDLTFCQIWFDGKDVWSTHPEHIQTKHGEMQNDYVELYAFGNQFLRNRISKYVFRGFEVDVKNIVLKDNPYSNWGGSTKASTEKRTMRPIGECNINFKSSIPGVDSNVAWARKMLFKAAVKTWPIHKETIQSNEGAKTRGHYYYDEDGYDSDDYVEDPHKLFEISSKDDIEKFANNIKQFYETQNKFWNSDSLFDYLNKFGSECDNLGLVLSESNAESNAESNVESNAGYNAGSNQNGGRRRKTRRLRKLKRKTRSNRR